MAWYGSFSPMRNFITRLFVDIRLQLWILHMCNLWLIDNLVIHQIGFSILKNKYLRCLDFCMSLFMAFFTSKIVGEFYCTYLYSSPTKSWGECLFYFKETYIVLILNEFAYGLFYFKDSRSVSLYMPLFEFYQELTCIVCIKPAIFDVNQ